MKKTVFVLLACAFVSLVGLVDNAKADIVSWATGGAQLTQVGNWGYPGSPYDIITLIAASGSLTLDPGTPKDVVVNPLTFEVGVNSNQAWTDTDVITRDITVNGVTKSLSLSNPVDVVVSYSDTLHVYEGPSVTSFTHGSSIHRSLDRAPGRVVGASCIDAREDRDAASGRAGTV